MEENDLKKKKKARTGFDKRQKVALELFTHGTNYTLLDADCVLTAKIGKSCKMEYQL